MTFYEWGVSYTLFKWALLNADEIIIIEFEGE